MIINFMFLIVEELLTTEIEAKPISPLGYRVYQKWYNMCTKYNYLSFLQFNFSCFPAEEEINVYSKK